MIAFAFGLVVGGVLGVVSTVLLGIMVHQRQEPESTIQGEMVDPVVRWIGTRDDVLDEYRFH